MSELSSSKQLLIYYVHEALCKGGSVCLFPVMLTKTVICKGVFSMPIINSINSWKCPLKSFFSVLAYLQLSPKTTDFNCYPLFIRFPSILRPHLRTHSKTVIIIITQRSCSGFVKRECFCLSIKNKNDYSI